MPYSLKSRSVLITGGSQGLGAVIAEKFAAEGSNVAINFNARVKPAEELAEKLRNKYGVKTAVLQADAGDMKACEELVQRTVNEFGGIDVIIGNADFVGPLIEILAVNKSGCQGWTRFSKFGDLYAMEEEEWDKCWAVNVKGQLALVRAAMPHFNKNPEGGVYILTSSIAGVHAGGSSMPYSVTKAAGLRLMKNMAITQGPKLRANAVLPGLLLTEWGKKYPEETIKGFKETAVLKQETLLDDCADAYIALAKNTSMTGMKIQVDSGVKPDTA